MALGRSPFRRRRCGRRPCPRRRCRLLRRRVRVGALARHLLEVHEDRAEPRLANGLRARSGRRTLEAARERSSYTMRSPIRRRITLPRTRKGLACKKTLNPRNSHYPCSGNWGQVSRSSGFRHGGVRPHAPSRPRNNSLIPVGTRRSGLAASSWNSRKVGSSGCYLVPHLISRLRVRLLRGSPSFHQLSWTAADIAAHETTQRKVGRIPLSRAETTTRTSSTACARWNGTSSTTGSKSPCGGRAQHLVSVQGAVRRLCANECASHARTVPKPAMTGGLCHLRCVRCMTARSSSSWRAATATAPR